MSNQAVFASAMWVLVWLLSAVAAGAVEPSATEDVLDESRAPGEPSHPATFDSSGSERARSGIPEQSVEPDAEPSATEDVLDEPAASGEAFVPVTSKDTQADSRVSGIRASLVEVDEEKPDFGILVAVEHAIGTGTFLKHPQLREQADYVVQSWDIRPSYSFDAWNHRLKVMARILFEVELTQPNKNPSRRFTPYDTSAYLIDEEIYTEPYSGITLNGSMRLFLPTSYESIRVRKRWSGFSWNVGLKRSLGPVELAYSFAVAKYFHGTKVKVRHSDVARTEDQVYRPTAGGDPLQLAAGYANTNVTLTNYMVVAWNITEELSLSYTLYVLNHFSHAITAERDAYTSVHADAGPGRADQLWPTLEISYSLSDALGDVVEIPFGLDVGVGITALHPAQSDNNKEILWPFFYQVFAKNRAANNYGSVFFQLVGTSR